MAETGPVTNARGEQLDPDRAARTTVEPYPHEVVISANGKPLARTRSGLLLRETYAPDIYVPEADVRLELLTPGGPGEYCACKTGTPTRYDAIIGGKRIEDIAWSYNDPVGLPSLKGHVAFAFDKVRIEVDGQLVRGHVRDPRKTITVTPVPENLRMELAGHTVVNTDRALLLRESGLPARYYVPPGDVARQYLVESSRQTVCTYKGEAAYHHLRAADREFENAVWEYAEPWTDFAADIGKVAGHLGFYTSIFDRVLLNDTELDGSGDSESDRAMISKPTADRILRGKRTGAA